MAPELADDHHYRCSYIRLLGYGSYAELLGNALGGSLIRF